eukprot:gnl/Spiro4/5870_TR3001_c0_g1_i1.p1 gnl/Spiro4/5870_TR3001_c0_g1~~gnl/Spiro4/5870_TR3001_c0_g1_i1.p1  ORF type:complete len:480 (-),score=121.79 gnl/Spiro4/5870_TR3001_c0_g1_i1:35-1426(-)
MLLWMEWVAGVCSFVACALSFHLIVCHYTYNSVPEFQKAIVRIILMVPVYSIEAYISLLLVSPGAQAVVNALLDLYEGYVVYQFIWLLIAFLGGEAALVNQLEMTRSFPHPWPMNKIWGAVHPNRSFLHQVQRGVLQFVLVKPLTSVIALLIYLIDHDYYVEGSWRMDQGYPYLAIVDNISVSVSLYCLVLFYLATHDYLAPFAPIPKFLCVKSVVFFTFWQGMVISIVCAVGILDADGELGLSLQPFLICVEMLGFSIAHYWAFSYQEFESGHIVRAPLLQNITKILTSVDVREILTDTKHTFNPVRVDFEMHERAALTATQHGGSFGSSQKTPDSQCSQLTSPTFTGITTTLRRNSIDREADAELLLGPAAHEKPGDSKHKEPVGGFHVAERTRTRPLMGQQRAVVTAALAKTSSGSTLPGVRSPTSSTPPTEILDLLNPTTQSHLKDPLLRKDEKEETSL